MGEARVYQDGKEINPTYERAKLKVARIARETREKKEKISRLKNIKSSSKRMKAIHSAVGKLLAKRGSYRAMQRQTIKLQRTPVYEGGKVALLNVGRGFFKR